MVSPLEQAITATIGRKTRPVVDPEETAIEAVPRLILRNDPNRLAFTVHNLGLMPIMIGPFPDVSSIKGFRINPSGASAFVIYTEDFHMVGWDWFAVTVSGSSNILTIAQVVEGGVS